MSRRAANQLQLDLLRGTRGGWRPGAGRKPSGTAGVRHATRPFHDDAHPLHVTWRVRKDVPNLRKYDLYAALKKAFREGGRGRVRLCHYSVQSNHLHLICEAADRLALSRGLQGLGIRIAKGINRRAGRRGRVLGDRFHARALATPLEVRRALAYVLNNHRRHGATRHTAEVDLRSSAYGFNGWKQRIGTPCRDGPPPVVKPGTWLLRTGWRRHGLLSFRETPGAPA